MSDPKTRNSFGSIESITSIRRVLAFPDIIDQRYRVLGRLGTGSQGVVLRAEDLFLQRPVAIKLVESSDAPALDRFVKEAQSLAQVRHENIVQVYAFGPLQLDATHGSYFLAMELVGGRPLDFIIEDYASRGAYMPLPRAMSILRAIGQGLAAVHARNLIHRDVKPGNVIVETNTDRPVLIDFGLARRRSASSPKMSISGGTPSYMAPEQARDHDGSLTTSRTDLYAFACTVFEVLTGHPPFEGDDIYTVLLAHIHDPPRKISSLRPELAPLDPILARALSKAPEERYGSTGDLVAALEAAFTRIGQHSACALVFAADPSLRRSLVRSTTQALKNAGISLNCETAASAQEAARFIPSGDCELVVIDEDSAGGRLGELVAAARSYCHNAEVVVISRDLPATQRTLAPMSIRHLVPKPINVHVLSAVIHRLEMVKSRRPGM